MNCKDILSVKNLKVQYKTKEGLLTIVHNSSFSLSEGKTLGIVGESGSGKSQTCLAILRLLSSNAVVSGEVIYNGVDLLKLSEKQLSDYRGNEIAITFQDSMTALNPYITIKDQLIEPLIVHKHMSVKEAEQCALDMLDAVEIPDAKNRINFYPHEFSGGMRQRVMIAMALMCHPKILIADELTTALDVTIQAQILRLLHNLQEEYNMAMIFITHDLGVLSKIAHDVMVMYYGHIIEHATTNELFENPLHPYTRGLLGAIPRITDENVTTFKMIEGESPIITVKGIEGCPFEPRCKYATSICKKQKPNIKSTNGHSFSCFNIK